MLYKLVRYAGPETKFQPEFALMDDKGHLVGHGGKVEWFVNGTKALQYVFNRNQSTARDSDGMETDSVYWEGTTW